MNTLFNGVCKFLLGVYYVPTVSMCFSLIYSSCFFNLSIFNLATLKFSSTTFQRKIRSPLLFCLSVHPNVFVVVVFLISLLRMVNTKGQKDFSNLLLLPHVLPSLSFYNSFSFYSFPSTEVKPNLQMFLIFGPIGKTNISTEFHFLSKLLQIAVKNDLCGCFHRLSFAKG